MVMRIVIYRVAKINIPNTRKTAVKFKQLLKNGKTSDQYINQGNVKYKAISNKVMNICNVIKFSTLTVTLWNLCSSNH